MTTRPTRRPARPLDLDVETEDHERASAEALLSHALGRWGRRIAVGTAFQDEGLVVLDLAVRIDPRVRVFTLDTGRLPAETHRFVERVRQHYGIEVEVHLPDPADVEPLVRRFGTELFRHSVERRLACCRARKVAPMGRVLSTLDAWITGLRREQAPTRAEIPKIGPDPRHPGVIKVNPLADWNAADVAAYLERHSVPRHPLYARGYASIGCAPCTRPTPPGADPRAGRWWWEREQPKECGLHWGPREPQTRSPRTEVRGAQDDSHGDAAAQRDPDEIRDPGRSPGPEREPAARGAGRPAPIAG